MSALFALPLDRNDIGVPGVMLSQRLDRPLAFDPEYSKRDASFGPARPCENCVPVLDCHGERLFAEIKRQAYTPRTNTRIRPATQRAVKPLPPLPKTASHSVAELSV